MQSPSHPPSQVSSVRRFSWELNRRQFLRHPYRFPSLQKVGIYTLKGETTTAWWPYATVKKRDETQGDSREGGLRRGATRHPRAQPPTSQQAPRRSESQAHGSFAFSFLGSGLGPRTAGGERGPSGTRRDEKRHPRNLPDAGDVHDVEPNASCLRREQPGERLIRQRHFQPNANQFHRYVVRKTSFKVRMACLGLDCPVHIGDPSPLSPGTREHPALCRDAAQRHPWVLPVHSARNVVTAACFLLPCASQHPQGDSWLLRVSSSREPCFTQN